MLRGFNLSLEPFVVGGAYLESRRRLRLGSVVPSVALAVCWLAGCGPVWHFDYDEAVRQARRSDRDVLILYKDPLDVDSGTMRDILESPQIASKHGGKVWCAVVPFYAPNRKFVAQYGVTEAPAVVVVHPDDTYHALLGVHASEAVERFLDGATAPGSRPKESFQVPRRAHLDYFNVFERALDKARRQNRTLCVVYKWWLDPNSTELIRRITSAHVSQYFTDKVNCVLDWDHAPNRRHVAKYGVREYPAVILVEPDGQYRVLRGLREDDDYIRFAAGREVARASGGGQSGPPWGSPNRWFVDFDTALDVAARGDRHLVVFYHSSLVEGSEGLAEALEGEAFREVLGGTVNCWLNWRKAANRHVLGRYGVASPPALLLVRPDGSSHVLGGSATAGELAALLGQ